MLKKDKFFTNEQYLTHRKILKYDCYVVQDFIDLDIRTSFIVRYSHRVTNKRFMIEYHMESGMTLHLPMYTSIDVANNAKEFIAGNIGVTG